MAHRRRARSRGGRDRDREAELRALLTRASDAAARRLAARDRQDWPAVAQAEAELRRLYRRHEDLERARAA